ncbi:MAG: NADPH:quinone oxidoreductase family protein [Sphingomonadaceae bacterium]
MRAIQCVKPGPPEDLVLANVPDLQPGAGEVRVSTRAMGVNFPDGLIIAGKYQYKPDLPFSPGAEAAGVVDAIGAGVTGVALGDRVISMTIYGAFAEQVLTRADQLIPIPDAMPFDIAAGFTMTYGTSFYALAQRGALQPGETLLVLGAAGGVGLAAIEIAKAMEAKVIAAASSDGKLALCREHGADDTINYTTEALRDGIRRITPSGTVDLVYDPVGGPLAELALRSLAWGGRYLVIGFAAGEIPRFPANLLLMKGTSAVGVFWGDFVAREPAAHQANMRALFELYAQGKLRPHIDRHFPLEQTPEAIRRVMDRQARGKVVVTAGG